MTRNPIRTCIGCGGRDQRGSLLRLVARPHRPRHGRDADTGSVFALAFDASGSAAGRGAYLHRNEECWAEFAKRRGTIRSLRAAATPHARAALLDELRAGGSLKDEPWRACD